MPFGTYALKEAVQIQILNVVLTILMNAACLNLPSLLSMFVVQTSQSLDIVVDNMQCHVISEGMLSGIGVWHCLPYCPGLDIFLFPF